MATESEAKVTVKNTTFQKNNARIGGAICVQGGSLKADGGTYSNNYSASKLEDIRCNSSGTLTLSGKVEQHVGLNNNGQIFVNEELDSESKVYIRIVNSVTSKEAVIFAESLTPDESQRNIFEMCQDQTTTHTISFADNKLTITK